MLTVKTYLAPSRIHGIGLFAAETIPKNTIIWKLNHNIDHIISQKRFIKICREVDIFALQHLLNSSYKRNGKFYYLTDNARFINHSEVGFNVAFSDDCTEVAVRDITIHEELLENYFESYDTNDFFFVECMQNQYQYIDFITAEGKRC